MIQFSYTLSPLLQEHIGVIESLRAQILLTPLSRKTELRLRFENMIGKVYWSMSLWGSSLTKTDIEKLLRTSFSAVGTKNKKATQEEKAILSYKKALDFIDEEWYVTTKPVRLKDLLEVASIVETKQVKRENVDLSILLDYLHTSQDHPVIQSAIAQMQIICLSPFVDGNGRVARLLGLLYLYKQGLDFRGMLSLEEYWRKDLASLEVIKDTILKTNSLNVWLEYFAQGLRTQLEKAVQKIKASSFQSENKGFWEISDRQKAIVSVTDFPHATITNRKVQKQFSISQITASRDLAKLALLGLLIPHGKGRSVYYTRA